LVEKIKKFQIDPPLHQAIWDYSETNVKYPVWLILKSGDSGIIYSEYGFEHQNWGLIKTSDYTFHFGMDFQWYPTLEEAFLDSWMADAT